MCACRVDTPKEVKTKVYTYAFSGGRATMKEHRELGADLEVRLNGVVCVALSLCFSDCICLCLCALFSVVSL